MLALPRQRVRSEIRRARMMPVGHSGGIHAIVEHARARILFGLTAAEAKLASLIASGPALDNIAGQLGIARETARNQLKAVFAKTETHRQGEPIALTSQLAPAPSVGVNDGWRSPPGKGSHQTHCWRGLDRTLGPRINAHFPKCRHRPDPAAWSGDLCEEPVRSGDRHDVRLTMPRGDHERPQRAANGLACLLLPDTRRRP